VATTAEPKPVDDGVCPGIAQARQASKRDGRLPHGQIRAHVRIGQSLGFDLPESVTAAIKTTHALFDLAMDFDPRELSQAPVVDTAYGELPVVRGARCVFLEKIAKQSGDERANRLLRAAAQLDEHLEWIHRAWDWRRREVWRSLREAELIAAQKYFSYLVTNLGVVRQEKPRYARDKSTIRNLWAAALRVNAVRERVQVDTLKLSGVISGFAALGLTIWAIAGSVKRGDLTIDDRAQSQMDQATNEHQSEARKIAAQVEEYLKVLRHEAETFPVLLVMDHSSRYTYYEEAQQEALEALDAAEVALAELCEDGAGEVVVPDWRPAAPEDVAERIARSNMLSVWKMPFFMDAALLELPPRRANTVRRMRRFAADIDSKKQVASAIMSGGADTASLFATLAGPIGISMAVMWGMVGVLEAGHDHAQLRKLFSASLSPNELLRGGDHDPPSKAGVVLSLLGLIP
jgi:hypothetical protein